MTDLIAQIFIGGGSIAILSIMFIYCDEFSDGNVGG